MPTLKRPLVLLVDDEPSELGPHVKLLQKAGASSEVLAPDEIDEGHLKGADLVVVDYTLDNWQRSVDRDKLALWPANGIALAAILREQSRDFPPTGYALISGKPDVFGHVPSERRPHIISRLSNLEWFFEKKQAADAVSKMISLASAIRSLPENVQKGMGTVDKLLDFLGIPADHRLRERYHGAVERCRPPIHHLAERSHGLVVLRWLLHRIIPHTCFLVDSLQLAARLRVTSVSLMAALKGKNRLSSALNKLAYTGPLADFDGQRWWRDGLEQWLWDNTDGQSSGAEAVFKFVSGLSKDVRSTPIDRPVVTVGPDFQRQNAFSARDAVVPLKLDDWPDYAEPAYATKKTLDEHPEMRMFVANPET